MINVLITGADGQLGSEVQGLADSFKGLHLVPANRQLLDITNQEMIEKMLSSQSIDVVINCAAYTNVEQAEEDKDGAMAINATAPGLIGAAAEKCGVKVMHISTDYVFDGSGLEPLTEEAKTNPISEYGASKLHGEKRLLEENPEAMVFRTSWLYSTVGNNFFKTMCKLGTNRPELNVVSDQVATPTYARILARDLLDMVMKWGANRQSLPGGVYHYSHHGEASWHDFAVKIFELSGIRCEVKPVASSEFPTKASRPAYSKLANNKIIDVLGLVPVAWEEALAECVNVSKYEHV